MNAPASGTLGERSADAGASRRESPERAGKGSTSVRAQKRPRLSDGAPWQKLELFPTPPWATRALFQHVLPVLGVTHADMRAATMWEPAAGLGHMSEVLCEYAYTPLAVRATDVFCYPLADGGDLEDEITQFDFLGEDYVGGEVQDWIITNPPFGLATEFLDRALKRATRGVAFFVRLQWLESARRYEIFAKLPPTLYAPFAERVALCEGGLDPELQGATAHGWFVWKKDASFNNGIAPPFSRGFLPALRPNDVVLDTFLIPPGCKAALTKPGDQKLAARCVPGFIPPSVLKKSGKGQGRMNFGSAT